MCNAMNRSVSNVLIGGFGEGSASAKKSVKTSEEEQGVVQELNAEDVVQKLTSAKSVIVVPGYGMVSFCGHPCKNDMQIIDKVLISSKCQ